MTQTDRSQTDNDRLAVLEENDGRCVLRFVRLLHHPREVVWRAVTEPDGLRAWFPQRVEYLSWDGLPRAGAPVRFTMPNDPEQAFDGEVLAFEPPVVFELRWGTDVLRLELDDVSQPGDHAGHGRDGGDGEQTLLTLLDTFDEQGKAARDGAGWHACLDALLRRLEYGEALDVGSRWAQVHPVYVQALGPQASTIGPGTPA
jgi:uncharacterized protein YndB with AHSA1/START domain